MGAQDRFHQVLLNTVEPEPLEFDRFVGRKCFRILLEPDTEPLFA